MTTNCITKQETRNWVRAWIWFWYNDVTRMGVILGAPAALAFCVLAYLGLDGDALRKGVIGVYATVVVWAFLDNDYSKLRRIGLNEYRKPLPTRASDSTASKSPATS